MAGHTHSYEVTLWFPLTSPTAYFRNISRAATDDRAEKRKMLPQLTQLRQRPQLKMSKVLSEVYKGRRFTYDERAA